MTKTLTTAITLSRNRVNEIQSLLDIDDLDSMSEDELDEAGAKQHDRQFIYEAQFPDGSILSYELCSGSMNYWGDITWLSPDRSQTIDGEPTYEINRLEMTIGNTTYVVDLNIAGD